MPVQNGERLATKQDLADMYQEILPYLGGSADAGFTPIGTIISIFGESAPANYLICDGSTYNVADYPELCAHLWNLSTNSQYKVSGDVTKFKVPDLRGQFLRGTGTNSDTDEGSGSAVGVRQKATEHQRTMKGTSSNSRFTLYKNADENTDVQYADKGLYPTPNGFYFDATAYTVSGTVTAKYTSRPTNTSVLFCIATKNIYLNPSLDYSTDEKVVGTWIDGKTLYQRTIQMTTPSTGNAWGSLSNPATYDLSSIGIDKLIYVDGFIYYDNGNRHISNILNSSASGNIWSYLWGTDTQLAICVSENNVNLVNKPAYVTIRYTKA